MLYKLKLYSTLLFSSSLLVCRNILSGITAKPYPVFTLPSVCLVFRERPILGNSPKPHFLTFSGNPADFSVKFTWNPPEFSVKSTRFQMKSARFHDIHQIPCEIHWISCLKALNQITQEKKLHFDRTGGELCHLKSEIWQISPEIWWITWNPPVIHEIQQDFTKSNRISQDFIKSRGFNTIS